MVVVRVFTETFIVYSILFVFIYALLWISSLERFQGRRFLINIISGVYLGCLSFPTIFISERYFDLPGMDGKFLLLLVASLFFGFSTEVITAFAILIFGSFFTTGYLFWVTLIQLIITVLVAELTKRIKLKSIHIKASIAIILMISVNLLVSFLIAPRELVIKSITPLLLVRWIAMFLMTLFVILIAKMFEEYRFNYRELGRYKVELEQKNEDITAQLEEITAIEEELRLQYEELKVSRDAISDMEQRYRLVAESSNDIIWDWDINSKKFYATKRLNEILGYDAEEEIDLFKLLHPDDYEPVLKAYRAHIKGESEFFTAEHRIRMKSGDYKWFLTHGKAIVDEQGKIIRRAGSLTDITDKKAYEQEIITLAYNDYLTGLPNKIKILELAEQLRNQCLSNGEKLYVAYLDIDNFKKINDTYGHDFGDRVLKEFSLRLRQLMERVEDLNIGRLSGDEFILLIQVKDDNILMQDKINLIFNFLDLKLSIDDYDIQIGISMGIACYPEDEDNIDEILIDADFAMQKVKLNGKNKYLFYNAEMGEENKEKITMEGHLKNAIEKNELCLYYQPQINIITGKIEGFEALIRWFSPVYGMVSPVKFIPLAEETGIIIPIGRWVMDKTIEFASRINSSQNNKIRISFNTSPIQLMQESFLDDLKESAERYQINPEYIGIEITESTLLMAFNDVSQKLTVLKEQGYRIYLDDFGTGYSSLNYLKNLPIDVVKIDKCFVDDTEKSVLGRQLMKSIIALAKSIGLEVVAEGVETRDQYDLLQENNCDLVQGYLISKPIPESDINGFLVKSTYL